MPFDGVGGQEMAEQLSDDAETIGLVSVDGLVVLNKLAFEKFAPEAVKLAKSGHVSILFRIPMRQ